MAIQKNFANTSEVLFLSIAFLQKWSPDLKENGRDKVGVMVEVGDRLVNFKLGIALNSNMVEI
jgi:hypothetical protein